MQFHIVTSIQNHIRLSAFQKLLEAFRFLNLLLISASCFNLNSFWNVNINLKTSALHEQTKRERDTRDTDIRIFNNTYINITHKAWIKELRLKHGFLKKTFIQHNEFTARWFIIIIIILGKIMKEYLASKIHLVSFSFLDFHTNIDTETKWMFGFGRTQNHHDLFSEKYNFASCTIKKAVHFLFTPLKIMCVIQ